MQSPYNPAVQLQPKEIEPGLSAYVCPESGGIWIPLQAYFAWREQQPAAPIVESPEFVSLPADDSKRRALICPESGRVLLRYKVGQGLNFHIDRSPATGGVWLDKGEWEALRSKNLHTQIHLIFTASYQRQIRSADYEQSIQDSFKERIGTDFARVEEFKDWLMAHPRRREIFGYLSSYNDQPADPVDTKTSKDTHGERV
jgi:Zn-finger nucleic acid-binding protein